MTLNTLSTLSAFQKVLACTNDSRQPEFEPTPLTPEQLQKMNQSLVSIIQEQKDNYNVRALCDEGARFDADGFLVISKAAAITYREDQKSIEVFLIEKSSLSEIAPEHGKTLYLSAESLDEGMQTLIADIMQDTDYGLFCASDR